MKFPYLDIVGFTVLFGVVGALVYPPLKSLASRAAEVTTPDNRTHTVYGPDQNGIVCIAYDKRPETMRCVTTRTFVVPLTPVEED